MNIIFKSADINGVFGKLAESFKARLVHEGFEYSVQLPDTIGSGSLCGYVFEEGFSMISMDLNLYRLIQFTLPEEEGHIIRYIFLKNGSLIHTLAPGFRYRLTSDTSAIASSRLDNWSQTMAFPTQAGLDLIIIQINTEHFARNLNVNLENVSDKLAKAFSGDEQAEHFLYHSMYPLSISETIMKMKNSAAEGLVKRFFIESKALELLWMQTEHYNYEQKFGFDKNLLRKFDIDIIKRAYEYLDDNLGEDITIESLARIIGTNETKLKKGFKKLYGKTFGEVLRNKRLLLAKSLLEDGKMSVKEISSLSGYKSASMFTKRFKEKYGILPGRYIAKY
ncbi:MAG: helix-turn-helix transcriptional regulator [Cyclonatronaceae bacterium]